MLNDLTKTFFDTFGIEHEERYYNCKDNLEGKCGIKCPCECCDKSEEVYCYPQITDRHYLELICVLGYFEIVYKPDNCEELKKYILDYYLNLDDSEIRELKHQVQAIFEGER